MATERSAPRISSFLWIALPILTMCAEINPSMQQVRMLESRESQAAIKSIELQQRLTGLRNVKRADQETLESAIREAGTAETPELQAAAKGRLVAARVAVHRNRRQLARVQTKRGLVGESTEKLKVRISKDRSKAEEHATQVKEKREQKEFQAEEHAKHTNEKDVKTVAKRQLHVETQQAIYAHLKEKQTKAKAHREQMYQMGKVADVQDQERNKYEQFKRGYGTALTQAGTHERFTKHQIHALEMKETAHKGELQEMEHRRKAVDSKHQEMPLVQS